MNNLLFACIAIALALLSFIAVWNCAKISVKRELLQEINSLINPDLNLRNSVDTLPLYTPPLEAIIIKEDLPNYDTIHNRKETSEAEHTLNINIDSNQELNTDNTTN